MQRILKKYDTSIFEFIGNFMKVSFNFKQFVKVELKYDTDNDTDTSKENQIIKLIKKDNKISARQIAKQTGYGIATIKRHMSILKEKGTLKRIGTEKKDIGK